MGLDGRPCCGCGCRCGCGCGLDVDGSRTLLLLLLLVLVCLGWWPLLLDVAKSTREGPAPARHTGRVPSCT